MEVVTGSDHYILDVRNCRNPDSMEGRGRRCVYMANDPITYSNHTIYTIPLCLWQPLCFATSTECTKHCQHYAHTYI